MPKTRQQKEAIIKSYLEKMQKAKSVVFINFKGLKVKDAYQLRKKSREAGAEYMVAKKTLMKLAFQDAGLTVDPSYFPGDVGTLFGYKDEITAPKIVKEFSKDHEAIVFLGGILGRVFIDKEKILELSKIPSKKELWARLVGSINSPLSGFVNVLAGNLRGLVQVLRVISEKK